MASAFQSGLLRDTTTGALVVSGASSIAGQISRMVVFGDSITAGYGPAKLSQGWAFGVSKALGCDVIMYAQGAAAWAQEDTGQNVSGVTANGPRGAGRPGGWASIINACRALLPAPGASAGVPLGDFVTFAYGLNDLWTDAASAANTITMLRHVARMGICLARAGTFAPTTDGRWNFSAGGWAASGSADDSFGGVKQGNSTTTNDAVYTIPATSTDTETDLYVMTGSGAPIYEVRLDSVLVQTLDLSAAFYNLNSLKGVGAVIRVTHTVGAHTVSIRRTSGGGQVFGASHPSPSLPRVMVIGIPQSYGGAGYIAAGGGVNHTPITDADIVATNAAYAAVVAEFDAKVKFCDMDAAWTAAGGKGAFGTAGSLTSDALNVHPSARGHQVYAEKVLNDLYSMPQTGLSFAGGPPTFRRILAAGGNSNAHEPIFSTNWSGTVTPGFVRTGNGEVNFKGRITKSIAGVANETIFTLPEGVRPSQTITLMALNQSAAVCVLAILNTGAVTWVSGDPTVGINIDGLSFMADG